MHCIDLSSTALACPVPPFAALSPLFHTAPFSLMFYATHATYAIAAFSRNGELLSLIATPSSP
jgi:hypothetical protein